MFIYEKALKESLTLCLSIEREWLLIQEVLDREIGHEEALHVLDRLVQLMVLLERSDAKVKLLNELAHSFEKIDEMEREGGSQVTMLSTLRSRCNQVSKALTTSSRILSRGLISDNFLSRFYYKQDPIYGSIHAEIWSKQSSSILKEQIQYWLSELEVVWHAVEMILWMVRSSGSFSSVMVTAGFHRESIKQDVMRVSMIRVRRDRVDFLPSLTLAQHWLVITVYQMIWEQQAYQMKKLEHDVSLSIALCK